MTDEPSLFLFDLFRGQELRLEVEHLEYNSKNHQFYLFLKDGRKISVNARSSVGKILYAIRDKFREKKKEVPFILILEVDVNQFGTMFFDVKKVEFLGKA